MKMKNIMSIIGEIVGTILVIAIMVAFCTLCVVGSGYHWE